MTAAAAVVTGDCCMCMAQTSKGPPIMLALSKWQAWCMPVSFGRSPLVAVSLSAVRRDAIHKTSSTYYCWVVRIPADVLQVAQMMRLASITVCCCAILLQADVADISLVRTAKEHLSLYGTTATAAPAVVCVAGACCAVRVYISSLVDFCGFRCSL